MPLPTQMTRSAIGAHDSQVASSLAEQVTHSSYTRARRAHRRRKQRGATAAPPVVPAALDMCSSFLHVDTHPVGHDFSTSIESADADSGMKLRLLDSVMHMSQQVILPLNAHLLYDGYARWRYSGWLCACGCAWLSMAVYPSVCRCLAPARLIDCSLRRMHCCSRGSDRRVWDVMCNVTVTGGNLLHKDGVDAAALHTAFDKWDTLEVGQCARVCGRHSTLAGRVCGCGCGCGWVCT